MNNTHLHLIINHLPSIGLLIGILVLLAGSLLKKTEVKLTAFGVFIFSAVTSIFAYYSGEGAEEVAKNLTGISETLIHTHEEYAEFFFIFTLILGTVSIISFIAELKRFRFSKHLMILSLLIALVDGIAVKYVGTSGGEIRHPEIRIEAKMIDLETEED